MADHSRVLEISQIKLLTQLRPLQFRPEVSFRPSYLFRPDSPPAALLNGTCIFTSTVDLDTGRELSRTLPLFSISRRIRETLDF